MPLKPIIFLQLLTSSQFVLREFGKDAISEPASMFPGQKSAKRQQTTDSNPSDAQEKAGWGVEDEWGVPMERKHNAPLHRGMIDGIRQVINQMQQKGRMGVRGETRLPRDAWLPRERDVPGMWAGALLHTEGRERPACPNLAHLMKNGKESAYLAHPSLPSTAAPSFFLLPITSAALLPPLHPPRLSSVSRL